jgi:hypothetical protein
LEGIPLNGRDRALGQGRSGKKSSNDGVNHNDGG